MHNLQYITVQKCTAPALIFGTKINSSMHNLQYIRYQGLTVPGIFYSTLGAKVYCCIKYNLQYQA